MADTIPSFRSRDSITPNYATWTRYDTLLAEAKQETHSDSQLISDGKKRE
ncbi:MAG: hypothetical protein ACK5PB_07875 [Pirellula sp.]